ncbi:MAG TPA: hypothetical protein VIE91_06690 [Methylophilaceae bacterium]|jgi:hypothetical protein
MQISKKISITMGLLACLAIASIPAVAGPTGKTKPTVYSEDDFLRAFNGKSRQVISDKLGAPVKKEQGVRPSNAANVVGKPLDTSKPVNVEMWYYKNIVRYDPKRTYKEIELTFVNDRCMNIAFFNNR